MQSTHPFMALLLSCFALACGPGTVGEVLRPSEPTAADALGEGGACKSISDSPEPFLVDWTPQDRGKLQRAMQSGVAVLSYDCKGIRVLVDCKVEGEYTFAQIAKEGPHKVLLDRNSDLSATIPLSAVSLDAEVKRGMKLDLAYMMVGSRATIKSEVVKSDLGPSCERATHFVRAVWLGAFRFGTATEGSAAAGANVLGAGTQASDASAKQVENQAGDLAQCDKSAGEKFSDGPPAACEAPVRLELVAIRGQATGVLDAAAAEGDAPAGPAKNPCGEGFVLDDKKICVTKAAAAAYLCDPKKTDECIAQCDAGSAESCFNAAGAQFKKGAHPDSKAASLAAAAFYEKGCAKGHPKSCTNLAQHLAFHPEGDKARAKELFTKACESGEAAACLQLANGYRYPTFETTAAGFTPDLLQYVLFTRKACDLGSGNACSSLARAYIEGIGVAANPAAGLEALSKSCSAGDPWNCYALAEHHRKGDTGSKDPQKAADLHQRNCEQKKHGDSCVALGMMYRTGDGPVAKSYDKAKALFESRCPGDGKLWGGPACVQLGLMYQLGEGVAVDELRAMELFQRTCKPDDGVAALGCYEVAVLLDGGGKTITKDPARAAKSYDRACRRIDGTVRACQRAVDLYKELKDDVAAGKVAHFGCMAKKDAKLCAAAKKLPGPSKPPPPPGPKSPPPKAPPPKAPTTKGG